MNDVPWLLIASLLMLGGFTGILIPALPGIPYMWLVAVGYALVTKFATLTWPELGWLGAIAAASLVVDLLAGALGSRIFGAGKKAALWGALGMLLGAIVLPPLGGFVGLFVGVLASEAVSGRGHQQVVKAAVGSVIGALAGAVINFGLGVTLMILFISWAR